MSTTQILASPNQNLPSIFDMENMIPAQVEQLIPIIAPAYSRPVLSKLIDQLGAGATQKNNNIIFNIYRQPNDYAASTIQTQSSSGNNLVLTLTGDSIYALQAETTVTSESGCVATVVSNNNDGTIILRFKANPNGNTSFDTGVDFLNGQQVSSIGTVGSYNDRTVSNTPFTLPTQYQNYISQFDAKTTISFTDAHTETYVSTPLGKFYALRKEAQTLQKMMQEYNVYMLKDIPMVADSDKPIGSSVVNQIKTMGGLSIPLSAPLTIQAFRDAARQYKAKGGFRTDEIVVVCGTQYLGDIQEDLAPYILTAGKNNVVGGEEVLGLNIMVYGFEGMKFKFIADTFLDNQRAFGTDLSTGFSKRSRSAIWIADEKVKTENGGDLPFVRDYYYGSTADIARQVVVGMTDERGNYVKQGNSGKKQTEINFSINKTTQLMNPAACLTHGV